MSCTGLLHCDSPVQANAYEYTERKGTCNMHKVKLLDKRQNIQGILSVIPAVFIILSVRFLPIIFSFIMSFTNWDGLTKNRWIGIKNYITVIKSGEFLVLLRNNLFFLLHIPILFMVGLIFALLMHEKVRGWKIFRSLSFVPQIVSAVIIGYLFKVFFAMDGPVNMLLRAVGLDFLAVEWLASGFSALVVIMICIIWQGIGWQALLILGGLSSIDNSIFEAAIIDGAGYWNRLFKIVIPLLVRVVEYSFVIGSIWVFTGLFSFIFALTGGGPGFATATLDYMIYLKAFVRGSQMGYACAISVLLFIIVMGITKLQMMAADRADDWGE